MDLDVVERYRRAQAYLEDGAPLAALRVLDPARDEVAATAAGQLLLARAYFGSAQLDRARDAFERVVDLDPVDAYARFGLGRVLERQSKPAEALTHYRLAAAMAPRPEYQDRLAVVADRLGVAA